MSDIRVGDICVIERRFVFQPMMGPAQFSYELAITRLSPKRAYLGRSWFTLSDPWRLVLPRYLDYLTRVVEIRRPAEPTSNGETDRAEKAEARVTELETELDAAAQAYYDLESLIDYASNWINDSTWWESDEHLAPMFQEIRDRQRPRTSNSTETK